MMTDQGYGYPTTMRYSRRLRQSGTEYANAIEKTRRTDYSGIAIVTICGAAIVIYALFKLWGL